MNLSEFKKGRKVKVIKTGKVQTIKNNYGEKFHPPVWCENERGYEINELILLTIKIKYGRTAYVKTDAATLDRLNRNFSALAMGDGQFCTTREDIISWLDGEPDYDKKNTDLLEAIAYLKQVEASLEGEIGDVIFHN